MKLNMKYPRITIERDYDNYWNVYMYEDENEYHFLGGGFLTLSDAQEYVEKIRLSLDNNMEII